MKQFLTQKSIFEQEKKRKDAQRLRAGKTSRQLMREAAKLKNDANR